MAVLLLDTLVDSATEDDSKRIVELLWQRPAENVESWHPPTEGFFMVARIKGVVQGFFTGRIEGKNLIINQLECEHKNGRPTKAGRGAAAMLVRFIRDHAIAWEFGIMAFIGVGNKQFVDRMFDRGGAVTAVVMYWPPGFSAARRRKRTTV